MESSGHKETLGEEKALPPKKRCKFDASRPGCESASVSAQDLVFGSHDLTGLVLRFLPAKDKLLAGRCLTVSRQWRDLCRSNIVWHSIGQEDCKFLSRKTGTDDEEESGDDGSDDDADSEDSDSNQYDAPAAPIPNRMERALNLFGKALQSLRLVGWPETERDYVLFYDLIAQCPNIRHFGADISASDTLSVWSTLQQLERLDLTYDLSADEIEWKIEDFTRQGGRSLKELRLPLECDYAVPEFYGALLKAACEHSPLTTLQCIAAEDDEVLTTIRSARSLTDLQLKLHCDSQAATDALVALMQSQGSQLRTLVIDASYDNLCIHRDDATAVLRAITNNCGKLDRLRIDSDISDQFVHPFNRDPVLKFLRKNSTLTELGLGRCTALQDRYLACILEQCPNLQHLALTGCTDYGSDELELYLEPIIRWCSNLRSLKLDGENIAWDEAQFALVAESLPYLQYLDAPVTDRTDRGRVMDAVNYVRENLELELINLKLHRCAERRRYF